MLDIEEKDPVINGKYADDLCQEYKSVYGDTLEAIDEFHVDGY